MSFRAAPRIAGETPRPRSTAKMLRAHLFDHNLRVALLAALTVLAVTVLWQILYVVAIWLALFFITAAVGFGSALPWWFEEAFWLAAALLLTIAWIDRSLRPDDRPRDHRPWTEIILDIVLLLPRMTLSIWSTLSAWQYLDSLELHFAADLVNHLAEERRLRLQSLPLDIPQADTRFKILLALQLVQIIDVRREDRDFWVYLNPLRPRAFNFTQRRAAAAAVLHAQPASSAK